MWNYEQSTGKMTRGGVLLAVGYSGNDGGKNNPVMQDEVDIGPLPCGFYTLEPPVDSPRHGPFALPLVPDPSNTMFGRNEFMIHGDSLLEPGHASEGCIILDREARMTMWNSNDKMLRVVAYEDTDGPLPDFKS